MCCTGESSSTSLPLSLPLPLSPSRISRKRLRSTVPVSTAICSFCCSTAFFSDFSKSSPASRSPFMMASLSMPFTGESSSTKSSPSPEAAPLPEVSPPEDRERAPPPEVPPPEARLLRVTGAGVLAKFVDRSSISLRRHVAPSSTVWIGVALSNAATSRVTNTLYASTDATLAALFAIGGSAFLVMVAAVKGAR